jgi:GTPase SAR1 family protein/MFS family permease
MGQDSSQHQPPNQKQSAGDVNISGSDNSTAITQTGGNTHIDQSHHTTNIYNPPQTTTVEKRNRTQQQLLHWVETEVEKRLQQSLHNRVYIVLEKEENPEQVQHPWEIDIKVGEKPSYRLSKDTRIEQIFNYKDIAGRLLILGAPGAGKTIMLLKLAEQLVKRAKANPDHPIPVLLNLSSWKEDKQSIKDWMVADLKPKYGVRKDIAEKWIEQGVILPLLDGLDELDAARQEKCVEKINEFLHPETWSRELVVCSRLEEYQHYPTNLGLNGSIILKPLTTAQIQEYVLKTKGENLWNSIKHDSDLMELAQTPLFLNIIIVASQEIHFEHWNQFKSSEKRRGYLFDAYIQRMLKRPYKEKREEKPKPYKDKDTVYWLGWLARQLIRENQTEFLIEKMQPTGLENRQKKNIYRLIYGLTFGINSGVIIGIIIGFTIGVILGMIHGLIYGIIFGVILGLIYGMIYGLSQESFKTIQAIELLKISFNIAKINIIIGGISGGIVGIILGLIYGIIIWLFSQEIDKIIRGIIYGFITGEFIVITYGIIYIWKNSEIKYKYTPNQGIWQSLKNITTFTSIAFLPCLGLFDLLISEVRESVPVINRLIGGIGFSLLFAILRSGLPVIQHFSLRLVLWFNHYIPWNYARFLDYSTDRLFLQRVGGGYRFIHDLLRQHFAEKY